MVRVTGILISFLLFNLNLEGQSAFAPVGAKWIYEGWMDQQERIGDCDISDCPGNFIQLECVEQRIIQDSLCSIVISARGSDRSTMSETGDTIILYGNNRREYFYQDSMFYLMNDYNLEEGDSLIYYVPADYFGFDGSNEGMGLSVIRDTAVIGSKTDLTINGDIITSMTLRPSNFDDSIPRIVRNTSYEGVGSLNALGGMAGFTIADGCGGFIWCYQDPNISFNIDQEDCSECQVRMRSTSTDNIFLGEEISIFPNPVVDVLTLQSSLESQISTYEIYDFTGKLISSGLFRSQLDLSPFDNGVYQLVLRGYNGEYRNFRLKILK